MARIRSEYRVMPSKSTGSAPATPDVYDKSAQGRGYNVVRRMFATHLFFQSGTVPKGAYHMRNNMEFPHFTRQFWSIVHLSRCLDAQFSRQLQYIKRTSSNEYFVRELSPVKASI